MGQSQAVLQTVLADVGGTHIRFAMIADSDASLQCIKTYRCADFAHLENAIDHYLDNYLDAANKINQLNALCLAVPGDVTTEPIQMVNLPWAFSPSSVAQKYACQVHLLNDFSAQALAIPAFNTTDLQWLRGPTASNQVLTRAIIGPGTGLGAAALLPDGVVAESEAGHISFAPQSSIQKQIHDALTAHFGRVSVERLLSGPGLANIYRCLQGIEWNELSPAAEMITDRAMQGDSTCLQAIDQFIQILGNVSGDLALALGAKGGIYLSGGVLRKLDRLFDHQLFLDHFNNKGRFTDYCNSIPVALVLTAEPGLLGAAQYARQQFPRKVQP